ncbi:hypothetical protein N5U55_07725 [Aliarcobacter butzleri]|uniref:sulfotransferase family protein n=1 Tax=Aliarcobacter butzleri TaxID=28197 RepID=UPI0021B40E8B|nr:hypothetical protein [Aliarcobacter butzleri]MCT7583998.1 hypothetical protein [Aliarcobacter butzleri]
MKQTCILVLGMHRSGTSALTGLLSLLDVYLGSELMKANFANEKGYFENNILYRINEKLLAQINSSWEDVFYNEEKLEHIKEIEELTLALHSEFEYANIFAIKDPRLAFLFPVYKKVLEDLNIDIKIILPYRNPIEVANSLKKRNDMSLEKGMLLWAYHFLLAEKFSREYDRVFVSFDELMSDTSKVVEEISSKLSLDLESKYQQNQKEIDQFLEPSLKHHNISIDNLSDNTPKIVKDILNLKDKFNDTNLCKEFDTLRYELFSYQKLFYNTCIVSSLDEGQRVKQNLQTKEQELVQKNDECLILNDKLEKLNTEHRTLNAEHSKLKQNLQTKEQELVQKNDECLILNDKLEKLNTEHRTLNAEHSKLKQNLQTKEQELVQKNDECSMLNEKLKTKEQELSQTKQNLQNKEQEIVQKNDECSMLNEKLKTKEQELSQTKQNLQTKEQELSQTKQNLQTKEQELENIKTELANIYISKSWKLTRPLRRFMRIIKK